MASLLVLLFTIGAAIAAGFVAGWMGLLDLPMANKGAAVVLLAFGGTVLAFFILNRSHA
jgi:hypothetical protein